MPAFPPARLKPEIKPDPQFDFDSEPVEKFRNPNHREPSYYTPFQWGLGAGLGFVIAQALFLFIWFIFLKIFMPSIP